MANKTISLDPKKSKRARIALYANPKAMAHDSGTKNYKISERTIRSIEEGKSVIRSANNGISAYISPKGQVIDKILPTDKGFIEFRSFKNSNKTIFSSQGNKIFFYFLFIYISLIFFLKLRENK